MATTATTLAGAVGPSDWLVTLASATGLKAGDNIVCEQESMKVLIAGSPAVVYRGNRGTAGKAHAGGVAAAYGGPTEFAPGVGVTSVLRAAAKDVKAAEDAVKEAEEEKKANEPPAA